MNDLVFTPTRTQTKELYTPKDLHDCKYVLFEMMQSKNLYVLLTPDHSRLLKDTKYFKPTTKGKLDTVYGRQTKTGVLRLTNKEKYDRTLYNYNKYYIVHLFSFLFCYEY